MRYQVQVEASQPMNGLLSRRSTVLARTDTFGVRGWLQGMRTDFWRAKGYEVALSRLGRALAIS